VAIPSSDATSQDALSGAAVELVEDLMSNLFNFPRGRGVVLPSS
jgi:hypothetical protein